MDFVSVLEAIQRNPVYLTGLIFFAWYPIFTSALWVFASVLFYARRERHKKLLAPGDHAPPVTILIAAYNEEAHIENTILENETGFQTNVIASTSNPVQLINNASRMPMMDGCLNMVKPCATRATKDSGPASPSFAAPCDLAISMPIEKVARFIVIKAQT